MSKFYDMKTLISHDFPPNRFLSRDYPERTVNWLKKPTPMTVAIGFKCSDGILLATDRQYSGTTSNSSKRLDAEKITIIDFDNGYALVAESGGVALSRNFVETFRRMAETKVIADRYSVSDTAEAAMFETKRSFAATLGLTLPQLDEKFRNEGLSAECIVASIFNDEKLLFTISSGMPKKSEVKEQFIAVGSGCMLAEHILGMYHNPDAEMYPGSVLAAHVIEVIKEQDAYCGGRPNIFHLYSKPLEGGGICGNLKPEVIDEYVAGIRAFYSSEKTNLRDRFWMVCVEEMLKRSPLPKRQLKLAIRELLGKGKSV